MRQVSNNLLEKFLRGKIQRDCRNIKQVAKKYNESISSDLVGDIRSLIETARHNVAVTVNAGLTILYWQIGSRIRQDIKIIIIKKLQIFESGVINDIEKAKKTIMNLSFSLTFLED